MPNSRASLGFTLFELLVVLAIISVLLLAAGPSLGDWSRRWQLKSAASSLIADLRYARSEAIYRNQSIVVCPGSPVLGCQGEPEWHSGWLLFEDDNGDRDWQSAERLLRDNPGYEALRTSSSAARSRLRFLPDGSAPGSNATLLICHPGRSGPGFEVRISASGRIRLNEVPEVVEGTC